MGGGRGRRKEGIGVEERREGINRRGKDWDRITLEGRVEGHVSGVKGEIGQPLMGFRLRKARKASPGV